MNLPFFYAPTLDPGVMVPALEEDTMRHMVQVLRMQKGDWLKLTNGRGLVADAQITDASKKQCTVEIRGTETFAPPSHRVTIAISPLKNASRFEWFLEKAAEAGVAAIVPLLCSRTERQIFRKDRWTGILVSAMLQSQQAWLTELSDPLSFDAYLGVSPAAECYIAHCMEGGRKPLQHMVNATHSSSCILIGPEGDFTKEELVLALEKRFHAVSLGHTRLRTETAGITAAILLTHPA
jgi:16S rRNA (uracil1498-N3)-methyltransferase